MSNELQPDQKLCPFCAEVIKKAAVKCRWCGSDLPAPAGDEPEVSRRVASAPRTSTSEDDSLSAAEDDSPSADTPASTGEGAPISPSADAPAVEVRAERASKPRAGLLTAGLAVVVLLAAAGLALAVHHANGDSVAPDGELSSAAARAGIMAEAGTLTTTAMSYRAAHADDDIAAAEKLMTPAMRKKYEADLPPAADRATQAKENVAVTATLASLSGKASCQSDDCAVSIVSATSDRARVLVFVDQSATAASSKHSVASPAWELLTLVKQDGSWLIDDMAAD